jgi:hypothetical protein
VFGRLLHHIPEWGAFYRRPLSGSDQVLGINKFKGLMKLHLSVLYLDIAHLSMVYQKIKAQSSPKENTLSNDTILYLLIDIIDCDEMNSTLFPKLLLKEY